MKHLSGKNVLSWLILLIAFSGCYSKIFANQGSSVALAKTENPQLTYILPSPKNEGNVSAEEVLANHCSYRRFQSIELSAEQLSQIL